MRLFNWFNLLDDGESGFFDSDGRWFDPETEKKIEKQQACLHTEFIPLFTRIVCKDCGIDRDDIK